MVYTSTEVQGSIPVPGFLCGVYCAYQVIHCNKNQHKEDRDLIWRTRIKIVGGNFNMVFLISLQCIAQEKTKQQIQQTRQR